MPLLIIAAGIAAIFIEAAVINALWLWFVFPRFQVNCGFPLSFGICLISGILMPVIYTEKNGDELLQESIHRLAGSMSKTLFCLVIGFIVHCFM